mmetsp:Transcript_916/g.1486  ORF Transcript_916/g.1486 Transcript_916/m.1486 type:complete len:206 (-) Transcript_916:1110-1727(-)
MPLRHARLNLTAAPSLRCLFLHPPLLICFVCKVLDGDRSWLNPPGLDLKLSLARLFRKMLRGRRGVIPHGLELEPLVFLLIAHLVGEVGRPRGHDGRIIAQSSHLCILLFLLHVLGHSELLDGDGHVFLFLLLLCVPFSLRFLLQRKHVEVLGRRGHLVVSLVDLGKPFGLVVLGLLGEGGDVWRPDAVGQFPLRLGLLFQLLLA